MQELNHLIWQTHSQKFLEMAFRVDRQERLAQADGYGKFSRDCGDTIEFFLILENAHIKTVSYALAGCINTNACANAIIALIEGQSESAAWKLTPETVATYLESLPPDHHHCADLAITALRRALVDAREKRKAPWKKMYN